MYKANWPSNASEHDTLGMLEEKAHEIRTLTLETCINAGTGHVTSSMSCMDMLVALYYGGVLKVDPENPEWEDRDLFILSKAQASPALYAILADLGFYSKDELKKFAQKDGIFGVHLQNSVPGVEITGGSLGVGYGIGAGLALAAKMDRQNKLTVAMLGDGELYEGAVWETAAFVAHHKLNNFVTIVDRNYLCTTDFTENLIELEPLHDKWESFGFHVLRINGNSMSEVMNAFEHIRSRRFSKPVCIVADTVKGKGIPSMSDIPLWHGLAPKGQDAELAVKDLKESKGS